MEVNQPLSFDKSNSVKEIAGALAKAQAVMEVALKDRENPFFRSKYADLASIWDCCRQALTDNGIAVVQMPCGNEQGRVSVATMLMHRSGEWITATCSIKLVKDDPQGVGSAITYLRRYMLSAMAGVVADVDDDANHASHAGRNKQRSETTAAIKKVDAEQVEILTELIRQAQAETGRFCAYFGIHQLADLPLDRCDEAMQLLNKRIGQLRKPTEGSAEASAIPNADRVNNEIRRKAG